MASLGATSRNVPQHSLETKHRSGTQVKQLQVQEERGSAYGGPRWLA